MSEAAIAASADPAHVDALARAALNAVTTAATTSTARATRRRIVANFQRGFGQGLPIDGAWGPRTAAAVSMILDRPIEDLPAFANDGDAVAPTARPSSSSSSRRRTSEEPPARLATALRLAHWTRDAVESDETAAVRLRALNNNAGLRAVLTADESASSGELGRVPDPPDSESVIARARAAWERARASGDAAARELDARARAAVAEGERALREVRRALDEETRTATREALEALEAGLTAILRPLSRAVSTAVRPVAGPALLIGLGILAFAASGRR